MMDVLNDLIESSFHNVYTYQIITLCTFSSHNVVCQLHLNKAGEKGGGAEEVLEGKVGKGPPALWEWARGRASRTLEPGCSAIASTQQDQLRPPEDFWGHSG